MFDKVPIIMGGVENELACLMPQYINEDGWKLKKLADGFDQLGPEFLLGLAPEEVTNEDTATANIIRIEYMNEGILPFCIVILFTNEIYSFSFDFKSCFLHSINGLGIFQKHVEEIPI